MYKEDTKHKRKNKRTEKSYNVYAGSNFQKNTLAAV